MAQRICQHCKKCFLSKKEGRPPKYCSTECYKNATNEKLINYNHEYYLKRQEELQGKHRQWYQDKMDETKEHREQWLKEHPEYESYILVPMLKKEIRKTNDIIKRHKYNIKNKKKQKAYRQDYNKKNKKRHAESQNKYRQHNKDKVACRIICTKAVKSGRLHRQPCEICGTVKNINSHHNDYSKPLEVRWLCRKHHMELHRKVKEGYLII